MPITLNGSTGVTTPEVTVDNTSADGGQLVLKSSGFDNWNIDNFSGNLRAYYNATEQMRVTSAGLMQFNSGYGSVATAYGCRAWVNFNNTGTPSIRASGNVSSITDNGAGIFTVNFATAMPNTNYCVSSWVRSDATAESVFGYCTAYSNGTKTTSAMQFLQGVQQNGTTYSSAESSEVGLTFFR